MDVIYTDANRLPMGVLKKYAVDLDCGIDNDFEIGMNISRACMEYQSIWYVEGTEFGGIVDDITVDTEKNVVTYVGRSWRGVLQRKIIEPGAGKDYYVVSGDANDVLDVLTGKLNINDLFVVPDLTSGITINKYQFDRYTDAYTGIMKMLALHGAKLRFRFTEDCVLMDAVKIEDLSEKYEYSDDYGMRIIMSKVKGGVNHLICLGKGDLAARDVIHLYVDADGNISEKQYYTGLQEITEVYDYGSAEDMTKLREGAMGRIKEVMSVDKISAKFQKLDVDVGDIVGGRNRLTGVKVKETVTRQIVKIENGIETIIYEIGGE